MARYTSTVRDQNGRPIVGALVAVSGQDGTTAVLQDDYGQAVTNPVKTDQYGGYSFNAVANLYDLSFYFGGRLISKDNGISIGAASLPVGSVLDALGTSATNAPSQRAVTEGIANAVGNISRAPTWEETYGAIGNGIADDTTSVANAIASVPTGGTLPLSAGKTYRVTSLNNLKSVGFDGGGQIVIGSGNAAYTIRPYARRTGNVHGREYLYRFYQRVGVTGTTLRGFLDGDSTIARGNTTVVGSVAGTTLTVTAVGSATLAVGTYVTGVSSTCRIVSQSGGTTFGNGTYQLSQSGTIAGGSTIAIGNGGGFAGDAGEPQQLLRKYLRRNGVRNSISLTNLAVGGSTWQDLVARNKAQYLSVNSDLLIVKAPVNRGASIAADVASMRQYFSDIRAATYGRVDLLTIVLVGYTPAHDTTSGRTSLYQELMHEACLQCVDDFKVAYTDIHGIFADASWMPNLYLDSTGVHPGGFLQQQIYYHVGRTLIEAGAAQLSTGDDWITLAPSGSYTAYDNGFGAARIRLKADGVVNLIGGIAPPSNTVTANDTLSNCPNTNYYPDTSVVFDATVFKADTSWGRIKCGVDVAGRIFARETMTGIAAVIFGSDTEWSVFTS